MPAEKFDFHNAQGQTLAALLDRPDGPARAVALFAHCFTCGKDIKAARLIAHNLISHGIAVLLFDFTGLGSSEGEFANTTFSSNVDDLVAAAIKHRFERPKIEPDRLIELNRRRHGKLCPVDHCVDQRRSVVLKRFGHSFLQIGRIFHPHAKNVRRTGQADKVRIHQLGSLSENAGRLHFQFNKGQRAITKNNDLHRQLVLPQRQEVTHQHGQSSIAGKGDNLAARKGELRTYGLRHGVSHGSVIERT